MSAFRKLTITAFLNGSLLLSGMIVSNVSAAEDFTADKVMKEMKPDEQYAYLAGVVEGLAVARYHKDEKNRNGMSCIYGWFYKDNQSKQAIMDAFGRFPNYPPGPIIDVLVKRKCGE